MIKFTKLTDYALALLCLMAKEPGKSLPAIDIADTTGLPATTVSKIMFSLLKAKILTSSRGRKGGYSLALPASQISLLDIVIAVEGQMYLVDCCDTVGKKKICVIHGHCGASVGLHLIDRELRGLFSTITLQKIFQDGVNYNPSHKKPELISKSH